MSTNLYELRKIVVKEYLKGNYSMRELARKFDVSPSSVSKWVKLYKQHGNEGLYSSAEIYSGEYRVYVIEYMHKHQLSLAETARFFTPLSVATVKRWNDIYMEDGPQMLYLMAPINKTMSKDNKATTHNVQDMTKEELIAEYERLRMENAYLKKLRALVQERVARENGTKSKQ